MSQSDIPTRESRRTEGEDLSRCHRLGFIDRLWLRIAYRAGPYNVQPGCFHT